MDTLLDFVLKAADVRPAYEENRCIVVSRAKGACTACFDACPHDAITITSRVEIDNVDCTGCGLCVQACPSGALEPKLNVANDGNARCSKVAGSAQSVQCLARLQPTDIVRLGGANGSATLGHGDCATCTIGSADVPRAVMVAVDRAAELAAVAGRTLNVTVERREHLDQRDRSDRLSRRSLLGFGLKNMKNVAGDALAPLERWLPAGDADSGDERVDPGIEHQRQLRLLELGTVAESAPVPFRLPRVADGCILCPMCTRACPTDAFSRELESEGGALYLDPERCVGCDACVGACPVRVITMDSDVTYGEITGGRTEAYRSDPERRAEGSYHR